MRRRTNRQKLRQSLHHSQNHTQQVIVHAFSPGSTGFSLSSWVFLPLWHSHSWLCSWVTLLCDLCVLCELCVIFFFSSSPPLACPQCTRGIVRHCFLVSI